MCCTLLDRQKTSSKCVEVLGCVDIAPPSLSLDHSVSGTSFCDTSHLDRVSLVNQFVLVDELDETHTHL